VAARGQGPSNGRETPGVAAGPLLQIPRVEDPPPEMRDTERPAAMPRNRAHICRLQYRHSDTLDGSRDFLFAETQLNSSGMLPSAGQSLLEIPKSPLCESAVIQRTDCRSLRCDSRPFLPGFRHLLEGISHLQDSLIVMVTSDNLQPHRPSVIREAAGNRDRGISDG